MTLSGPATSSRRVRRRPSIWRTAAPVWLADLLPPRLRERETSARERRPAAETFFGGPAWGTPLPLPVGP
ncbi:hypothetical protein ABTX34_12355 [Streptomyces sp. NPDC096538]|uniref:hypothetical protein n=1 Tax=Streptomyces sp. NPDC096538 TaxID=3155427 RepID=UPI00332EC641